MLLAAVSVVPEGRSQILLAAEGNYNGSKMTRPRPPEAGASD